MSARIHPTAFVHQDAQLADDVEVGPWAYIGPDCTVGAGSVIQMRATLEEHVHLAPGVTVGIGSVLGGRPQDLKFKGEVTTVEIGEGTTIREYVTINRGTSESMKTTVGKKCFLMSYVHLAHDCHLGDGVIISNGTQLAGHVKIDDRAIISGLCAVHQFAKIGRHCFIGGMSRVAKDIPPYVKAVGNPVKLYGLNSVGLSRSGFPDEVVAELKKAYRLFFRSDVNVSQAMERAPKELKPFPEVQALMAFVEESGRGIVI
ncbi:MAG: acyl-ACP--UDP-N-acetylglucosamine O-acyltransferase [Gemmatimonadales bacterium]|nr:acyl-ACP--UDP-N-acetylglucosamine O-acyltransferase [Gemmatimonadota bacterium]MCL4213385.1 acyl-ACP--UDP-N-acetylglucosamine O-acyltransferase [Gemmatimonadales bacterium]